MSENPYKRYALGDQDPSQSRPDAIPAYVHTWENGDRRQALIQVNTDNPEMRGRLAHDFMEEGVNKVQAERGWDHGSYNLTINSAGDHFEDVSWNAEPTTGAAMFGRHQVVSEERFTQRLSSLDPELEQALSAHEYDLSNTSFDPDL